MARLLLAHCSLLAALAPNAFAAEPFALQNQNPFVAVFGLPRYASANLLEQSATRIDLSYSVASSFDSEVTPTEAAMLDGESERYGVRYLRGLGGGWEVGVDLPYLRHSGGYLDSIIVAWHDLFDLPQGGRQVARDGQLRYAAQLPSESFALTASAHGVGDVQLLLAKSIFADELSALAWRAHLKLPTGDADKLTGSGALDVAASLHYARALTKHWSVGASVGATYLGEGDLLATHQRRAVGHVGSFVNLAANQRLGFTLQWDVHSQVYGDTSLRQLNETAYVLSFGATYQFDAGRVSFAVAENYPHPEITPDVAFQLGWRWVPAGH